MTFVPVEIVAEPVAPPKRPWGFWATIGLSVAVLVAMVMAQTVIVVGYFVVAAALSDGRPPPLGQLSANGLLLSLASWAAVVVCLPLTALWIKLRPPWSLREYFALRPASFKTFVIWVVITLAFAGCSDAVSQAVGRPLADGFMVGVYQTAWSLPLLWTALLVAAPAFEELFFRGFMFRGIQASKLGSVGAIAITAITWSALHMQYDLYTIAWILGGGVLIGIARVQSRSTLVTLAMHAAWNFVSVIEVEVYLRG